MNEELNRKLPFSLIAEQSLLGSILIDPASINEVADLIKADDFYITEHKQILDAIIAGNGDEAERLTAFHINQALLYFKRHHGG